MSLLMMKSEITVLYRFQTETYKEEDRGERERDRGRDRA